MSDRIQKIRHRAALAEAGECEGIAEHYRRDVPELLAELAKKCKRCKASTPEPPPQPGGEPVARHLIEFLEERYGYCDAVEKGGEPDAVALLEERRVFGLQKYGMELTTHNGRDALEDARQELGDLMVYLAQAAMEGREDAIFVALRAAEILGDVADFCRRVG